MISNHDRTGFIGASDTHFVVGNWHTKTFMEWWETKLGYAESHITNPYIEAGNLWEGVILDYLGVTDRDRQIIIDRLRVNFDGLTDNDVIEVKTHMWKPDWKPPKSYFEQCQVEMYASCRKSSVIAHYGLLDYEYTSTEEGIDESRLGFIPVKYDEKWINNVYLPRMLYLSDAIKSRKEFLDESEIDF